MTGRYFFVILFLWVNLSLPVAAEENPSNSIEELAKNFPAQVGAFSLENKEQFPEIELGLLLRYLFKEVPADVFLYPAPVGLVPGLDRAPENGIGDPLFQKLWEVESSGILMHSRAPDGGEFKLRRDAPMHQIHFRVGIYEGGTTQPRISWLALRAHQGKIVKVRVTYSPEWDPVMTPRMFEFLEGLDYALTLFPSKPER